MKKILVITNIPNPYRIPLFAELRKQLENNGMRLKVIFAAKGYKRRMFKISLEDCGFDYEILPSGIYSDEHNSEITYFDYKGLLEVVNREQPYRCIIAGFSPGTMQLFFRSFFKSTPFIIWSGSVIKKGRNDNLLRRIQRNIVSRKAKAFVAYGDQAKKYLISQLNIDPEKIAIARNTIDTTFFRTETERIRNNQPSEPLFHFLYIGYLVPRKNVRLLLEAVNMLKSLRQDFILDIVGDGESRPALEAYIQENNLGDFVKMHGFKQKEELPVYLAKAKAFLFQTDFDIWGLALNECMAAGLPCICSPNAGGATDLVKEDVTGWIIDYRNTDLVVEKMQYLLNHPEEAIKMGIEAAKIVEEKATLAISAAGFLQAIKISEQGK
jgi:glycosyltransferase involved in cell wall biosynthesis